MTNEIILASGSDTRKQMLSNAGVNFTAQTPTIDEAKVRDAMVRKNTGPADIAVGLSIAKAKQISEASPEALVIGSDQILEHNGEILGKTTSVTEARARLRGFRDSPHRLISAAAIVRDQRVLWSVSDTATIFFRKFTDAFLDQYLNHTGKRIFQSVACYELEGLGSRLVSKVNGDFFTVLGLPLIPLLNYLAETGKIKG